MSHLRERDDATGNVVRAGEFDALVDDMAAKGARMPRVPTARRAARRKPRASRRSFHSSARRSKPLSRSRT